MPNRVEVIYFPKRTSRPQQRRTSPQTEELDPSSTRTIEFQPVFEEAPKDTAAYGHQLFEAGRLDEARKVFEGLVGQDDSDAFSHTMLGTVYLALGMQDRALALFESALGLDPGELAARVYRAEIRINLGRTSAARQDLARVVREGDPGDPFVKRAKRLQRILADRQKRRRTPRK